MDKKTEALKLALEALTHGGCPPDCKDGMTDSGGAYPWGEAALIPCPNCRTIDLIRDALAEQPAAPQRSEDKKQWVGLTSEQWFSWWQVSTIMDNTEAEIDFADFLMIALAVQDVIEAKLKEKNGY